MHAGLTSSSSEDCTHAGFTGQRTDKLWRHYSLLVKVIEHLVGLLVGDHALVGTLHLIEEDDVDVCLGALAEASGDDEAVEQVGVPLDVLELVRGGRVDEGAPKASVLIAHIFIYYI